MDLITGFRRGFISVWLLLFIGNAHAQVGGGVAIGLGLGGDLMVDTAFGELPNPLVTMAAQGGHHSTETTAGSQPATSGTAQPTGGGFNVQGFSTLGSDIHTLFPIDASRIAGVANGQTIYLPGFFGSHLHPGSRVVLPAESTSPSTVDPNQQFVLQNEDFTALGNVGHLVRVPVPDASSSISASSISQTNNASSSHTSISVASDGPIAIDPKDIIGVADMNIVGPDGNPQLFSFNPGTGHVSELSALQSAMQGQAVDMTDFLPPPYDPQTAPVDAHSVSNLSIDSSATETVETTEVITIDVVTLDNSTTSSSNQTSAFTNQQGLETLLTVAYLLDPKALFQRIKNDGPILNAPNTHQNTLNINEHSMFDTGASSVQSIQNTNEKSMFNTGGATSGMNLNKQSMLDTHGHTMFDTGSATSSNNQNEQNTVNTIEQSMFDTGATNSMISNEQSMFNTGATNSMISNEQSMFDMGATNNMLSNEQLSNTGSATATNNLNEKSMANTLEQSMFDTGTVDSIKSSGEPAMFKTDSSAKRIDLNEHAINTNKQSIFDPTIALSGANMNEQSKMNTNNQLLSSEFSRTGTRERSMFNTGSSSDQNFLKRNENVMSNNVANTGSFSPITMNTGIQTHQNNPIVNERMASTNDMTMLNTNAGPSSQIVGVNRDRSLAKSTLNTESISGQLDRLSSGQDRGGLLNENRNILNINEASMFNSVIADNLQSEKVKSNTAAIENNVLNANDQSMIDIQKQKADIITYNQLENSNNQLTKKQNSPTNEDKMFNVDTTIGVRKGHSNSERTSIGGMFGVIDRQKGRQNAGLTGSRFSGRNTQTNTGAELGGGDTYTIESNIVQSVGNTGETSNVGAKVDLIQPITSGASGVLGAGETKANNMLSQSVSLTNSGTSVPDSGNTLSSQKTGIQSSMSNQNVPHVSDLTTEGLYPFEGSFTAREATLSEGSSAILDMSSVLQGHEPLHLEPSIDIVGEFATGSSKLGTAGNNTGIFAVVKDNNIAADITVDITKQGIDGVSSSDRRFVRIDGSNPSGIVPLGTNTQFSKNNINNVAADVSFVNTGENTNTLAIDKVNEYVGLDNTMKNKQTHFSRNGISVDLIDVNASMKENIGTSATSNTSKMLNNRNRLTEGDHSILNASKLPLTSLNDHSKGLKVAGNNNNGINTFNKLDTSRNVVSNKITTVADGVDVAMSGFSGAPITNMVGVIPGKSSGGLAVSGINVPSFQSTSASASNDFSSSLTQEFAGSTTDNTGFPSGSFVIGAGQPNSKIISASRVNPSTSNVGGVAIGAEESPGLASISLPASAFKANEKSIQDRQQTNFEGQRAVKVDMSNFIPPPYEASKGSQNKGQAETTHRVGSTAALIKNVLKRQNKNDRFNNRLASNTGSSFAFRSDRNSNNVATSNQDFRRQSNLDVQSDRSLSSKGTSFTDGHTQMTQREGSTKEVITNKSELDRLNRNDRFNNRIDSNQNVAFVSRFNNNMNSAIVSNQREASTKEAITNKAVQDHQSRNDRFNNRIDFSQNAAFASRSNNNMNSAIVSNQDSSMGGRVRLTDTPSTNGRTSTDQMSSIVKSNEHFGTISEANISPRISAVSENSRIASSNSLKQQHAIPSVVVDHAIFTDMARDASANFSANGVAAELDIHASNNQAVNSLAAGQSVSKPIVGSIFGTAHNSSSTLTKKFLEKSGITREPAVDFMTTFLHQAKPTRTKSGSNNVKIVPLSNFSPNSDNIVTGRQSDTQTVDQFGVADIYTRKQQLNPSQWQQLMSKVSHEQKTGRTNVDVDYQTQNVIGAGETKPLNGNINAGSATGLSSSAFSSEMAGRRVSEKTGRSNTNSMFKGRNNVRSSILFEAPGMTGHKSVTIPNYKPRVFSQPSRLNTLQSSLKSPSAIGQQNLQEFVGSQATAERTSTFANTFRQNQQGGIPSVPVLPRNNGVSVNSISLPMKDRVSADPNVQRDGQLGETGQKIQNEMNTFKLGRSILISDGVIPEFTGPNSVHSIPIDARDIQGLTVNGMRLGQPSVMSQSGSLSSVGNSQSISSQLQAESEMLPQNEVTLQDIQRAVNGAVIGKNRQTMRASDRPIGIAIGGGLNKDSSARFSQSQQNIGLVDNFGSSLQSQQHIGSVDNTGRFLQSQQNIGILDNFGGASQSQQGVDFNANKDISISQGNRNIGIAIRGDLDSGLSVSTKVTQNAGTSTGGQQAAAQSSGSAINSQLSTDMTNTGQRSVDTATILGLNDALKKQPMEPTLFTSGSRFAVFGRAGDVTGREVGNGHLAKPVPARRMGVLAPVHDCRYKPDPSSEYYFIYKNGITQHRFRCALGTAFDEMTCECSIRVSDHGDCLEVHMDFNNGFVEDSSLNRLPIGNENVEITNSSSPLAGIALFGGDGKLTIWRYQNYDFRDHVMLKVQFRPGVGGDRYQPLITNCDSSSSEPSLGIVYDSMMQEVILILKTVNDTLKELRFKVNSDEWNDVTFIYDGQEFIGIVNGVRRYVSRENPHLLGIIGGEIKSAPTHGLVEIRDAAVVLGHCPMYGYYRGAMVDIQIYTCIPKDFRLE